MDSDAWDPFEVPQISGHKLQVVVNGGCRDLEVRVCDDLPFGGEPRMDLSVDAR